MFNKNILIILGLAVFVTVLIVISPTIKSWILSTKNTQSSEIPCEELKKRIDNLIEQSNYCIFNEDCTIVSFGCPFGCGSYVNRNANIASIEEQVGQYRERCGICFYDCMRPFNPVCKFLKCVPTQAICQLNKVYEDAWNCRCPEGAADFAWVPKGTEQLARICKKILPCKGDSLYEKQALSYEYKVYPSKAYVQVTGIISEFSGQPAEEKTIKLYKGNRFYLPIKEGWASVELEGWNIVKVEKIEKKSAHLLFTYMAKSQSCDNSNECYACSFEKVPTEPIITTDKAEYERSETIEITLRNELDKPIWYVDRTPKLAFWELEKFENDKWGNIRERYNYQLLGIVQGEEHCTFIEGEPRFLNLLEPNSEISHEWKQKICIIDKIPYELKLIDGGKYRFSFTYGDKSNKNSNELIDKKTIYSNEFTIR